MNMIPWRNKRNEDLWGLAPVGQFRSEMDRLFDRFFRDPWTGMEDLATTTGGWMPSLDVSETDKEITVRAEVPGVDPKDLDIRVQGNTLTLSGEKSDTREEKGETFYRSERSFGSFRRAIPLPCPVDPNKVTAEHRAGVVTVRLTKTEAAVSKRIPVTTSSGR